MAAPEETSIVVITEAELRSAVTSNNGIDYVYLGADIVLTASITIHYAKPSLVIDGMHENVVHSFTDMNSTWPTDTIGVTAGSGINLTFKNMVIHGRNFYGVPYIADTLGMDNVVVIYENITYDGPQLAYNHNGLTRFIDCDITIDYPPDTSRAQEAGEVCMVEMDGNVTIRHRGAANSVFWFFGAAGRQYLRILPGANVYIETVKDFLFSTIYIPFPTARPVACDIQAGASFSLRSRYGFSRDSGQQASSFNVGAGAVFSYIQETNGITAGNASLYVNGAFTVETGANVYMQADYDSTAPLIRFATASASLTVDDPKSFVLYNRNHAALSFSGTTPVALSGRQVNYWSTARYFPTAGTFDDEPEYKWYKDGYALLTIKGTATATQTAVTANLTPEETLRLPDINNLNLQAARVLSIGNLTLTVNPVYSNQSLVGGTADPFAKIRVEYTVGGTDYVKEGTAGANGVFSVLTGDAIPAGTVLTVSANLPFLILSTETTVLDAGDLTLVSAPDIIKFVLPPISVGPVLLRRSVTDAPVTVSDTRAERTPWRLLAAIDGDFKTAGGHVLPDAVVFVKDDGVVLTLTETPVTVYLSGPGGGSMVLTWPENKGVLARITSPVRNRETYSNYLIWRLEAITE